MRIAYLCYWNLGASDGVAAKIAAQSERWRAAGHRVQLFAVAPGSPARRLARTRRALAALRAYAPDLVYVRYDLFLPAVWRFLRRLPTVVEVNSDDRTELRGRGRLARHYNELNRRRLLGQAQGIACMTSELASLVSGIGPPAVVIANGADPGSIPILPAPAGERPRAVFCGSPGLRWHGVDRLVELARALPEIAFDVVGPSLQDPPANVVEHGRLAGEAYWAVLARADVAIGSLALERAGLREGAPLKVREYLLAGIPTAIGYDDTDFPNPAPWYLAQLEDAGSLHAFVERARGRRVPRDEVEAKLSWHAKEQERLAFFERVVSAS